MVTYTQQWWCLFHFQCLCKQSQFSLFVDSVLKILCICNVKINTHGIFTSFIDMHKVSKLLNCRMYTFPAELQDDTAWFQISHFKKKSVLLVGELLSAMFLAFLCFVLVILPNIALKIC